MRNNLNYVNIPYGSGIRSGEISSYFNNIIEAINSLNDDMDTILNYLQNEFIYGMHVTIKQNTVEITAGGYFLNGIEVPVEHTKLSLRTAISDGAYIVVSTSDNVIRVTESPNDDDIRICQYQDGVIDYSTRKKVLDFIRFGSDKRRMIAISTEALLKNHASNERIAYTLDDKKIHLYPDALHGWVQEESVTLLHKQNGVYAGNETKTIGPYSFLVSRNRAYAFKKILVQVLGRRSGLSGSKISIVYETEKHEIIFTEPDTIFSEVFFTLTGAEGNHNVYIEVEGALEIQELMILGII